MHQPKQPREPASCDTQAHQLLSMDAALEQLLGSLPHIQATEQVPLSEALGRVSAEGISASLDIPGYANSAMDGYLLRAEDTHQGSTELTITQRIAAGSVGQPIKPGTAARIFTGAPIAPGGDAVIMQEECEVAGDQLRISRAAKPGENIRPQGNDVKAGTLLIPPGTRLAPQHLAVIASVGQASVSVYRRCRAAILYTGDELVEPGQPLTEGKIYNSNRYALEGLLKTMGCELTVVQHVADNFAATRTALLDAAAQADLIVSSGGVSVGGEDHVKPALEAVGTLNLWRIAMKPGKPLAYGRIGDAVFLGLPGNPVAVFVTFLLFVRPTILTLLNVPEVSPRSFPVTAGFQWNKRSVRREFIRVRLETQDNRAVAKSFNRQGSDVNSALIWASGLVEIPENSTIQPGDMVTYYAFNELLGAI